MKTLVLDTPSKYGVEACVKYATQLPNFVYCESLACLTKVRPHVAEKLQLAATLALFAQKLGDAWCLPGKYPS